MFQQTACKHLHWISVLCEKKVLLCTLDNQSLGKLIVQIKTTLNCFIPVSGHISRLNIINIINVIVINLSASNISQNIYITTSNPIANKKICVLHSKIGHE